MYGDCVLNLRHLILPHPRLHERKFVLMPSNEIAGEMINPVNGKSISLMLDECSDNSIVRIFENHRN
jgi:2-amino-4-hydroxy-6-hydroxymethyldihydropteridine diphosphokinase